MEKSSPHKIWKGTLSFGLVSVPVQVHTATKDYKSPLKQYRKSDLSPIRHKKVAEADGHEVPVTDIVKGLPVEDPSGGSHVVALDSDALAGLALESTKIIAIDCFVNRSEIDYRFYEKPYFLQPEKAGVQGYALLFAALKETDKVGIAKVALRNREYLVAVSASAKFNVLTLETLRWEDELLDADTLTPADSNIPKEQLKLAITLINTTTQKFTPSKYENAYTKGLEELIRVSSKGGPKPTGKSKKIITATAAPDMVTILQASLSQSKKAKAKK